MIRQKLLWNFWDDLPDFIAFPIRWPGHEVKRSVGRFFVAFGESKQAGEKAWKFKMFKVWCFFGLKFQMPTFVFQFG